MAEMSVEPNRGKKQAKDDEAGLAGLFAEESF